MKRKDLLYLISAIAITGLLLFLFIYPPDNNDKFTIEDIRVEIEGKIKKKVAVRKGLLTHAVVARPAKNDTLIFLGENIDSVNIGDNIFKHKNSPFFYLIKQGVPPKRLKYVSISKTIFNDENFPKEWKDSCKISWKDVVIN